MNFREYLKKKRKEEKLSMRKLASLTDISQAYLSQLESGKRSTPTPDILSKLAKGLNVPYKDLLNAAKYEEIEEYIISQSRHGNIKEYKETTYPDIKHFLSKSEVYHDKKRLSENDRMKYKRILDILSEDLEVNYPSSERIEEEHDRLMKAVEVNNKRIERKTKKEGD